MNTITKDNGIACPALRPRKGQRLDEIALALALIMTGALWLAPKAMVPEGAWSAGVGLILLGLAVARRVRGLRTGVFCVAVGLIALAAGIGRMLGLELPVVPILLIILGAGMVVKALAGKDQSAATSDAL
ncbi:MAG: hypothetical protein NTZ26_05905 [Candidatus Aminicenantes bacterium]|nr:hypothetical protein [Candidatus Aminicenantes bacterium]